MYYVRRASHVLKTRGVTGLVIHSLKFISFKLGSYEVSSYITDQNLQGGKLNSIGAVTARTLPDDINPALNIPFEQSEGDIIFDRVAVVAHIFYPELTEEIIGYIKNIPVPFGLFITTDTEEKKNRIRDAIDGTDVGAIEVVIRVTPNRGRDIAPKYIAFRDVYDRYEAFLHVHSKKSLHADGLGNVWRRYLFESLAGSEPIVRSNLEILSSENIGVVYPEHAKPIKQHINWGFDFPIAKELLARIGVVLDSNTILEFPSGSMFWGRSAAIKQLLDLDLSFDDFPEENAQIDGTLAHAIERSLLLFVERSGHSWARVTTRAPKKSRLGINRKFIPLLGSEHGAVGVASMKIGETLRILAAPQRIGKRRLNLMLPIIDPASIFGGIDTALKIFDQIVAVAGDDVDVRVIVTEARVGDVPDSLKEYIVQQIGDEAPAKRVIVDATQRRQKYLDLRPDDVFVATAWWTALNAFRLHDLQKSLFGNAPKVVYLIQDFEPDFYGWSTRYALAESTYMRGDDTIALINSEELLQYFETRYSHPAKMLIGYTPNAKVDATLTRVPRERIILFYSRPAALRNCFESGIDGLALWARRNPVLANKWKVYCIGEEFDSSLARSVPNCTVTGKMPLDEYARLLSQASVGVSLMISPHPSYPPLEMAYSGIRTITNKYMNKDLSSRSGFITSIALPTPELIAQALEDEVNRAEKEMIGQITPIRNKIEDIPVEVPAFDPAAVIRLLG